MGRERQKKKNRSSVSKAKLKTNRTKAGKKKVNFLGNAIIAANWDRKLTVSQNYKRLGLSSKLNPTTGGTEKKIPAAGDENQQRTRDSLAIAGVVPSQIKPQEVQVVRDPTTGRILKVIRPDEDETYDNPLNDPLNDLPDDDSRARKPRPLAEHDIVSQLEAQAAEEEKLELKKRPRQQSQREQEWLTKLVEKHGDNIRAMVRDKKLNPMQQTEGDISKRLKKWMAQNAATT
ncbi:hypothetical protein PV10_01866 [Exophiala mesophila]|uniref:Nucleolar protein 16 n=1 Tax=Exophiala mesophila TaxID=212818 RepID=A0A0D2AGX6_EXOME|nr:uncharacterized protein PV10_01866 [Exophiala mesophila]KIV98188.1 hypothetical protein PV10_01866 [Exophiala mesophila]